MNNRIFLDASFWIAYRDERQNLHAEATAIFLRAFQRHVHLVTTLPVICEIHAHFSRARIKKRAILDDFFHNPVLVIEEVSNMDHNQAVDLLKVHHDKSYSLCDAVSVVIMQRLKLKRVFAFDDHFTQFGGFEVVS